MIYISDSHYYTPLLSCCEGYRIANFQLQLYLFGSRHINVIDNKHSNSTCQTHTSKQRHIPNTFNFTYTCLEYVQNSENDNSDIVPFISFAVTINAQTLF